MQNDSSNINRARMQARTPETCTAGQKVGEWNQAWDYWRGPSGAGLRQPRPVEISTLREEWAHKAGKEDGSG